MTIEDGAGSQATVHVADDHPVFADAVARAIDARSDLQLLGIASDGSETLSALQALVPTVALIDHRLPSLSGLAILREVRRLQLPVRVIILSGEDSGALVYDAVQAGADGFLTKASTLAAICDSIAAVAAGETVIAPEVQAGLVAQMRAQPQGGGSLLSEREAAVLQLIAAGLSAPEIGERLSISTSTVKTHIKNLFEKLSVHDRAAAVAEAMRRGLLE